MKCKKCGADITKTLKAEYVAKVQLIEVKAFCKNCKLEHYLYVPPTNLITICTETLA